MRPFFPPPRLPSMILEIAPVLEILGFFFPRWSLPAQQLLFSLSSRLSSRKSLLSLTPPLSSSAFLTDSVSLLSRGGPTLPLIQSRDRLFFVLVGLIMPWSLFFFFRGFFFHPFLVFLLRDGGTLLHLLAADSAARIFRVSALGARRATCGSFSIFLPMVMTCLMAGVDHFSYVFGYLTGAQGTVLSRILRNFLFLSPRGCGGSPITGDPRFLLYVELPSRRREACYCLISYIVPFSFWSSFPFRLDAPL